jgi:hypothetical protein
VKREDIQNEVADEIREGREIADKSLREAIERAENGLIDADLGGGLIKQRIARPGQGKSGGHRTIIAYKEGKRAVFLYGFPKKDKENLEDDELEDFKTIGKGYLAATDEQIAEAITGGELTEIKDDQDDTNKKA